MKHIFIINPAAGQGKGIREFQEKVRQTSESLNLDYEIYLSKFEGDCETYSREKAAAYSSIGARFYACGGDGTINEVINGICKFSNVSLACIPLGTGNDLIRNFPNSGDFNDIVAQIKGIERPIDLIKYAGVIDGTYQERYCANMFNIGFDCNVVELAGRLKKKPLISGSMAYLMAVGGVFLKKETMHLKLTEGDEIIRDGSALLCSVCNGSYCGGGIYGAPQASMNDGYFDINLINDVTRSQFLNLFPKYKKGTHLEEEGIEKTIYIRKCKELTLETDQKNFFLCVDGEIFLAEKVHFQIAPGKLRFTVPIKRLEH